MKANNDGKAAEFLARLYLRCKGYHIIAANVITGKGTNAGEIDIIAEDRKYICFVEVKTRSENNFFSPAEAVDFNKRSKLISSANLFLKNYDMKRQPRFDIIEVYFSDDEPSRLNHIEGAFDGTGN